MNHPTRETLDLEPAPALRDLLATLHASEISLALRGDELAVRGETRALVPSLLAQLREHKPALVAWLKQGRYVAPQAAGSPVAAPPNLIPAGCEAITPAMLPLVQLDQAQVDGIVATVPGGAANVQDIYPLAPLQEGMLFQHLLSEHGDIYLAPMLVSFDSRERVDAFADALRAVVARHDVLRTSILWEGLPEPVQVVWRHAPLPVEEVVIDEAAGDVAAQMRARFDPRHFRIDLRQAPMLRLWVAADGPRWVVMLLLHHLAVDQTGLDILQEEVLLHLQGQGARLPRPAPFRNLVAQARLGVPKQEHEAFFRDMLADVDEPTAPYGLLDVQGSGALAAASRNVDAALASRLRGLSRRLSVSVASLCHLAWALVVGQSSGRDDVVFGTVLSGRMQGGEGADRTLGLYMNTLPVRAKLGDATAGEGLKQVHGLLARLMRHEHASLVLAQRCSGVAAPQPLFSALLNYRHAQAPAGAPPLPEGAAASTQGRTNYPFAMDVDDDGRCLRLTALVEPPADAGRVCGHMAAALERLAEALEHGGGTPLRDIDVLGDDERRQLLADWNDAAGKLPRDSGDACVHRLFEAHARQRPGSVALVHDGRTCSYGELNRRANRLARHLRALGVGPDGLAAVCLPRGIDAVVAIFAVLKAGGAYVPMDPSQPPERLRELLDDAMPRVLLADAGLPGPLRQAAWPVIDPMADAERWSHEDGTDLQDRDTGLRPEHLAYVIYTSGSTGRPKGVMVEHRQLAKLVAALCERYRFGPADRVLQFASLAFDVSAEEIFCTLAAGATLVLRTQAWLTGPGEFWRLCAAHGITVADLPTLFWEQLARDTQAAITTTVRQLIIGGEAVNEAAVAAWFERSGHRPALANAYGPTETTINATIEDLSAEPASRASIGRPIAGWQVCLLGAGAKPVPAGAIGELCIGGAGVARGYLNRPALTAERFIRDPFSAQPGARLYRTGDLARQLGDGRLQFIGRRDSQVKIRGHRIETGEIEARLLRHPQVREAAVVAREDSPGERRLVAYCAGTPALDVQALQAQLAAALPAYMVPAAWVVVEALPFTPNGKLDRKALPRPVLAAGGEGAHDAPQGNAELRLARIWAEVLGVERVGRHDDFFALGGHSLSAIRLAERMRAEGLPVDVRTVFAAPTLAAMAAQAGGAEKGVEVPPNLIPPGCTHITPQMLPLVQLDAAQLAGIVDAVPGGAANVQDVYPLAPLQEGILFHHIASGRGDVYLETSLFGVQRRDEVEAIRDALQAVVDRHDILRTAVAWEGLAEPVQVVWRKAPLHFEEHRLDPTAGDAAAQLRERFDPRRMRIDVRRAPMLQLHAAEDPATGRWLLMLVFHHLVADHTTVERMHEEMSLLLQGQAATLPVPVPFREFVAQARLGVPKAEHETFFREMLGEVDEPTLPFGLADVRHDGRGIVEARRALDAATAARLRERARGLGVSTAALFHLAWGLVLARTAGRDDVVFGTVLFGRMQGGNGADRALGLFINTLPIRVRCAGTTVQDAARSVHGWLTRLLRHEHAPLALAQRCSAVAPPTPLFSALLNYRHSTPTGGLAADGTPRDFEREDAEQSQERSNYPVTLDVDDFGQGFGLTAQVPAPLEPGRLCDMMVLALRGIAEALSSAPLGPLAALDVLPEAERHRLLVAWNDTAAGDPADHCLHELFMAQAARTPDAIAVVQDGLALSYRELDRRSSQLAAHLGRLGVKPDARVGLCTARHPDMVVALLAILKAGGAYLPLDPGYPVERLAHMVEDSAPAAVLLGHGLSGALRAALGAAGGAPAVDLCDPSAWEQGGHAAPAASAGPQHLAYVIYTSGSTGKPKGVMIEHRSACNYIAALRRRCGIGSGDRILQFSSINFDASIEEIFAALLSGATLVLRTDAWLAGASEFWQLCAQQGITVADLPTRFWQQVTQGSPAPLPACVRLVIIAGEAADPSAIEDWLARPGPKPRLLNAYGPTETTMIATVHEPSPGDGGPRCIGRPLDNSRAYVLDAHGRPAPAGVPGELFIGGVQVGRGYLNRPDLTAERFVEDPFHGGRMYKTGDRARWLPDGTIEFLGRTDFQLKIRGFRIEPAEIEAQLLSLPGIREAVVVARDDPPGPPRLVAYVTGGQPAGRESWHEQLARVLPEYMLPAAYVQLERLPVGPSGKLDRRALPAPGDDAHIRAGYEPPAGETESLLARIWAEVLGVERVGRHDDFFALGGHSLLAIRMLEAMRQQGLSADVRDLFAASTLAAFAAATEDMEIKI